MGAAAELERRTSLQHAHLLAVLVAEEGNCTHLLGLSLRDLGVVGARGGEHDGVDEVLDGRDLGRTDRFVVAEVETQPLGRHHRAGLLHVVAEHLAQRPVQQMCAGVVAAGGVALLDVDLRACDLIPLDGAADEGADVAHQTGHRIRRVSDVDLSRGRENRSRVADLAAGLGVERCAVEEHFYAGFGLDHIHDLRVVDLVHVVAEEHRGADGVLDVAVSPGDRLGRAGALARRTGTIALLGHQGLELVHVDHESSLSGNLLRQLDWKAEGVVHLKSDIAPQPIGKTRQLAWIAED